ncbi:hypothetical protein [Ottowia thiooxydans]|uniref:hypothetical protein n=1 Tax=Ottowia thiooxydans TaxID=219182 RepID=UPI00040B724F|nr:hypothetical protein [Ottowia thiooxydans]
MKLIKTTKAREALSDRSSLSMSQRRVLILCDGKRSRQQIVSWLGTGTMLVMDGLFADGYLALSNSPVSSVSAVSSVISDSALAELDDQLGSASDSLQKNNGFRGARYGS